MSVRTEKEIEEAVLAKFKNKMIAAYGLGATEELFHALGYRNTSPVTREDQSVVNVDLAMEGYLGLIIGGDMVVKAKAPAKTNAHDTDYRGDLLKETMAIAEPIEEAVITSRKYADAFEKEMASKQSAARSPVDSRSAGE